MCPIRDHDSELVPQLDLVPALQVNLEFVSRLEVFLADAAEDRAGTELRVFTTVGEAVLHHNVAAVEKAIAVPTGSQLLGEQTLEGTRRAVAHVFGQGVSFLLVLDATFINGLDCNELLCEGLIDRCGGHGQARRGDR